MSGTTSKVNIYYLPASEPVDVPEPSSRWTRLCQRLLDGWTRLRLSFPHVRIAVSRRCRHDDYSALLRNVVEESPAELIDRRRSRPSRPATVLDFETARLRLRPTTV
jgi:hypothetical protein